jgi:hypothetical protein
MAGRHVLVVATLLASAPRVRAAEAQEQAPPAPAVTGEAIGYGWVVPEQDNFGMADAWLDVGRLHVEGRYNYEGLRTGSVFVGANASAGDSVTIAATGMMGAVFGDTDGVAPGFRITLTWWKLDLSTEDEIVIDPWNPENSFVYSWSELGLSPWDWLRVGLVAQRMRVLRTELAFERGLFAAVSFGKLTATVYELNAGWTTPTWIFALAAHF